MTPQKIAEVLGQNSLCICPHFITDTFLTELQNDLMTLKNDGFFRRAGIGHEKKQDVQDTVRRDEIYWLENDGKNLVQAELWNKINILKDEFNKTLFLGLSEFEGHYAHYAAGAYYKKHFDAFQSNNKRIVSFILYLNKEWKSEDGGELRVIKNSIPMDIAPCGGTLVCFLSNELEHEVLLSHAKRLSFVGWYKQK